MTDMRALWQRQYPAGTRWHLSPSTLPLTSLLDAAAAQHPRRVCLDFLGAATTYRALRDTARTLAAGLQGLGVAPGDRVGLCLPNCPAYVAAYHAILLAGAVVVNFSPIQTADELAAQVRDSGTKVMFTTDILPLYDKVASLPGRTPLATVIVAPLAAQMPGWKALLFTLLKRRERASVTYGGGVVGLTSLLRHRRPLAPVVVDPHAPALLQYTGGTTGTPKGATLTHANLLANARQVQRWRGPTPPQGEVLLAVLPLFHAFAMTTCLTMGIANASTIVLLPKFDLPLLLATIRRTRATLLPGVPSLFAALADASRARQRDLVTIRWCVSGGAPLPPTVRARFEALTGCVLVEGYGLTEASPVVACNPRHTRGKPGSAGLPLPGTEVEIRSLRNPAVRARPGEQGEIVVKGPQVMAGYWNRPAETRQALADGWLRTGDVGYLDHEGYLFVTDRLKDIIISHGYNVYPRVIEDAMRAHPAIAEVTAIAIPHPHKGEVAKLFVALKPGMRASADDLLAFARDHLNPLECPVEVEIRASLPKTALGKPSKKELAAEEQTKRLTTGETMR